MTVEMVNNINPEGGLCFMTLTEATKRLPRFNGKRVHPSTAFRWTKKGIGGIFLQHWKVGRKIVTTEAALSKFFSELAQAETAVQQTAATRTRKPRHRTSSATRQREIDAANAVLVRAGIITAAQVEAIRQ